MNDQMAMANINMHAFELGDFGKLRKTIPMAAQKRCSRTKCRPSQTGN
jgi:hypothetical protein